MEPFFSPPSHSDLMMDIGGHRLRCTMQRRRRLMDFLSDTCSRQGVEKIILFKSRRAAQSFIQRGHLSVTRGHLSVTRGHLSGGRERGEEPRPPAALTQRAPTTGAPRALSAPEAPGPAPAG
ncbi:unnamed protein product [Boreogadus saida]